MEDIRLAKLEEFKAELTASGMVSKSMVLSLEEFIGDTVITSTVNPNKLTATPSQTLTEEVHAALDRAIADTKSQSIDATVTATDIIDSFQSMGFRVVSDLIAIMGMLNKPNSLISPEILKVALTEEKIKYRYVKYNDIPNDEQDTESLTDITTLPLDIVYTSYKDYFIDVRKLLYGNNTLELPEIDQVLLTPCDLYILALVKLVDGESISEFTKCTPRPTTIQDIAYLITNRVVVTDKLEDLSDYIRKYGIVNNTDFDQDGEAIDIYKALIRFKDLPNSEGYSSFVYRLIQYLTAKD